MAHELLFPRASCPPLTSTFSFADTPETIEISIDPVAPAGLNLLWCDTAAANGLQCLEWSYGSHIRPTRVEISSSLITRSENAFNTDESRLSLRKHFYQTHRRAVSGTAADRALRFQRFDPSLTFGRYLGFLDLRKVGSEVPLALGILAIPDEFATDPAVRMIATTCGPLFGGPAFAASVYSMHDPNTGGAVCAQACLIMILGILADRGAVMVGSHCLTYLGWRGRLDLVSRQPDAECVAAQSGPVRPFGSFAIEGLSAKMCADILSDLSFRVSARHVERKNDVLSDRLTTAELTAYLSAGFPVMFAVSANAWNERKDGLDSDTSLPDEGHAVLAVGYRQQGPWSDQVSFVVHDPGARPFVQTSRNHLFDASRKLDSGVLTYLPVGDSALALHLDSCSDYLRDPPSDSTLAAYNLVEIFSDCLTKGCLVRVGLIAPTACRSFFKGPGESSVLLNVLLPALAKLRGERYWCYAAYDPNTGNLTSLLKYVWLFDADRSAIGDGRLVDRNIDMVLKIEGLNVRVLYDRPSNFGGWEAEDGDRYDWPKSNIPRSVIERRTQPLPALLPSVMTSCSVRPLAEFIADVHRATGTRAFELFLLRHEDLRGVVEAGNRIGLNLNSSEGVTHPNPITRLLAANDSWRALAEWAFCEFAEVNRSVTGDKLFPVAFATHLPGITSLYPDRRLKAILALTNSVRMAIELSRRGVRPPHPVIEMVCGSILDPCNCKSCNASSYGYSRSFVSRRADKELLLMQSLREVVREVKVTHGNDPFTLALEVEPGQAYLLNGASTYEHLAQQVNPTEWLPLHSIMQQIEADPVLSSIVGLNMDIAHAITTGISANMFRRYSKRLAHGHISDLPRMHSKDQPLGSFNPVLTPDSVFRPYLQLLAERMTAPLDSERIGCSGAFSLELEGCSTSEEVFRSLPAMAHIAESVRWLSG